MSIDDWHITQLALHSGTIKSLLIHCRNELFGDALEVLESFIRTFILAQFEYDKRAKLKHVVLQGKRLKVRYIYQV